jgi:hypothetical protein
VPIDYGLVLNNFYYTNAEKKRFDKKIDIESAEMSTPMEDGNSVNSDKAELLNKLNLDNLKQYLYDEDFSKQIIELLKEKGINRPEDIMNLPAQVEQEINMILRDLPKKSKSNSLIDTISDDDIKMWVSHW